MVRAYPYIQKIRYKEGAFDDPNKYEVIETDAELLGCIPFENIIDYDIDGDEYYNYPHLFCDFVNVSDPYEKIVYLLEDGYIIDSDSVEKDI